MKPTIDRSSTTATATHAHRDRRADPPLSEQLASSGVSAVPADADDVAEPESESDSDSVPDMV